MRNAAAVKDAEQRKNDMLVYLAHDLKNTVDQCNWLSHPITR